MPVNTPTSPRRSLPAPATCNGRRFRYEDPNETWTRQTPASFVPKSRNETCRLRTVQTRRCEWCQTPLRHLAGTGRPRRYCDTRCRVAAHRHRELSILYTEPWQRRALAAGWRPPTEPR
jgi:hypothetical protein